MYKPLLFLFAAPALAQLTTGSISGYVYDPSRKPVPYAEVSATDSSRGLIRKVRTGEGGFYLIPDLAPAEYTVAASASGFEPYRAPGVVLHVNSRLRFDLDLSLGVRRESIAVPATQTQVHSESSGLGAVLDRTQIDGLPLNRRDFLQLSLLTPGVVPPVQASELSSRGGFAMHANGAREEFNNFLLDGVDNNDQYENTYVLQPSAGTIYEFKIATNSYSAEFGRSGGAQVNVVTRNGGNQWHGDAWEYLRNRQLDARNYFDAEGKPKFVRNQFGGGLGGPLQKERSFFYGSYDGLRERQGQTQLATVPTLEQRGAVPASRVSAAGAQILKLFPLPNLPGSAGNYLGQPVASENSSQVSARFDQELRDGGLLTFRYSIGKQKVFEPFSHGGSTVPGFGDYVNNTGQNAMIHHQRAFGARTVHSLHLSFSRSFRDVLPQNYQIDAGKLWNVSWLNVPARDFGYPMINVTGFSLVGDQTQTPINRHTNTIQLREDLTVIRGNHALKFGAEVRNVRLNGSLDYFARGQLSFSGAISGSPVTDVLLGYPSFSIQSQFDNPQTMRTTAYNAYVQDDWKVLRNLTVNAGLRYEYNTPPTDPHDRMSVLDVATGTVVNVGTNGISRSGIRSDANNFAPRAGVVWTPRPNLVVRGGYGVYYDASMLVVNSSLYFNPPYFNVRAWFPTATNLLTLDDPFPLNRAYTPPPSPNTLSPDITTAYLQHWNVSVERQLGKGTVASVAYAGSKGTHLLRSRDLNQALPGAGSVAARRPLPAFAGIFYEETSGNSNYQSFQASVDHRATRMLTILGAYTASKSIDEASAFLATQFDRSFPQNSRNYRAERGLSGFDMRQRLTAAAVYRLPWRCEIRGIATAQSGRPVTPNLQSDNSNTGNSGGIFGLDRPDVLHSPALANPTPQRWFDTGAFAIPERYHFGNAGRNIITGPGEFNVDLALSRRFVLRENLALTMDAQAFNLLNHAQFNQPEAYIDAPANFGRIFSARAPRQVQLALRLSF
jgi:hypothetical protein